MIGQYVIGLTLVVNVAMRWPSLIPAALIVAIATGLYGEQDGAAELAKLRRAAETEWQAAQGRSTAKSGPTEISTTVPATRSWQAGATQAVAD